MKSRRAKRPRKRKGAGTATPRRSWTTRVEHSTRTREPGDAVAARQAFLDDLTEAERFELLRELVTTRGGELCRAYRNLIGVNYGFRYDRKRAPAGIGQVERVPCVNFVVKRKWAKGNDGPADQRLPKELFAYWTVRGVRTLVAVPTDVDDGATLRALGPHADDRTVIIESKAPRIQGAITCGVERSAEPGVTYAVSCRHVFSVVRHLDPDPVPNASVTLHGATIGASVPVAGRFHDAVALSHDAQLARLVNPGLLRAALDGLDISGFAPGEDDVRAAAEVWIVPPREAPIRATVKSVLDSTFPINYGRDGVRDIRHEKLFLLRTDAQPEPGYSGARFSRVQTAASSSGCTSPVPAGRTRHRTCYGP